jgi:membrane protease YdiL (CAAX protease family)
MLLIMLLANCGVIAGYLWLTGGTTPYSGNQWFITEVIIVPLVEETFWRGIVFTILLLLFKKLYSENASSHLAAWSSGLAFGLLHANNLLAGVPLSFVAIQVLNATLWGVVYGYARAKTESVYPPIVLHAAMNLVVILF